MRKLFTLLVLLTATVSAALGQDSFTLASTYTAIDNVTTGVYAIRMKSKHTSTNGYFVYYYNNQYVYADLEDKTLEGTTVESTSTYLWQVTKTESGTYQIAPYSSQDNKWIVNTTFNDKILMGSGNNELTAVAGTLDNYTDWTTFKNGSSTCYITHNLYTGTSPYTSYLGTWSSSDYPGKDEVAHFHFIKAETSTVESVNVTYNVKDASGNILYTTTGTALAGATISSLPSTTSSHYYTISDCTNTDKVVSSTNNTFDFTATWSESAPIKLSNSTDKTWYTVNFRNNNSNYMVRTDDSNIKTGNYQNPNSPFLPSIGLTNGLWAFEQSGLGVKILNKNSNKYVHTDGGKASLTDANSATVFYTNSNSQGNNMFSLYYESGKYLGDHSSGCLGIWNNGTTAQNDGGSAFRVQEANDDAAVIAISKTAITSARSAYAASTDPTLLSIRGYDMTAINAATTISDLETAYTTTEDNIANADVITPDYNAYYRIRTINPAALNANYGFFSTEEAGIVGTDGTPSDSCAIYRTGESDKLVPQLWQFVKSSSDNTNTFKLKNANVGRYIANVTATDVNIATSDAENDGGDCTLSNQHSVTSLGGGFSYTRDYATMFTITINSHLINAYKGQAAKDIVDWSGNSASDGGNYWQFIKVTEIPVAIGETGWASVGLPFAVTLPEGTTVKAYKGVKAANGKLSLEEITGVIPANTGFLLASENGATTVNLQISTESGSADGNLLNAATAKRDGFKSGDNYFLAKDSNNEAAFLEGTITTVPCNKAFLPASKITGSTQSDESGKGLLSFSIGTDTTTGISSAVQSQSDRAEKYYDLSGRRVLFPSNGIFVTADGKKVFVK